MGYQCNRLGLGEAVVPPSADSNSADGLDRSPTDHRDPSADLADFKYEPSRLEEQLVPFRCSAIEVISECAITFAFVNGVQRSSRSDAVMRWKLLSLLTGVTLCGCAAVPPFGDDEPRTKSTEVINRASQIDPAQVAALQPGSQVEIVSRNSLDQIAGTVLQASPDGIVLINSVCVHRNPGDQEVIRRRMPCHWVSIRRIAQIETIAAAPADFVAPSVEINTNDTEEFSGARRGIDIE